MNKFPTPTTSPLITSPASISQSYSSIAPSEDDDSERQSLSQIVLRRGSKLSDIISCKEQRKRSSNQRPRIKKGFMWRKWVPERDLVRHRAPHPHLLLPKSTDCSIEHHEDSLMAASDMAINQSSLPFAENPTLSNQSEKSCSIEFEINSSTTLEAEDDVSSNSCSPSPSSLTPDIDSESTKSDNSFQTASSNPQLHPLPVMITDCYNSVSSRKLPHAGKNGAVVNKKL